jgi:16S rRNA G1207 methylase RsmC
MIIVGINKSPHNSSVVLKAKSAVHKTLADMKQVKPVVKTIQVDKKKQDTVRCTSLTKKKKPCPNKVDSWRDGTLCHIHDPNGTFKQQVKEKREFYQKQREH